MESIKQRLQELNSVSAGMLAACLAAMTLTSCTGWILNGSIYSHIANYYAIAREINTFAYVALFFVLFAIASWRPSWLDKRLMLAVSLGSLLTSVLVIELAGQSQDALFTVVGLLFQSIGSTWGLALVALALCSLSSRTAVAIVVAGGLALGEALRIFIPTLSFEMGVVAGALAHAGAILLLFRPSNRTLDSITTGTAAADLELANPESFLAPSHGLFFCALLFSFASGYALTLNEVFHAPISSDLVGVVLLGIAVWLVFSRSTEKEDTLFSLSVLLVIAGFSVVPFTFWSDIASANALLRIGIVGFNVLLWLVIVAVGWRNVFALLPTLALLKCMSFLGTNAGAIAGHTSNDLVGTNQQTAALIAAVALFLFVAFLWVGFRSFSFTNTIRGVASVATTPPPADDGIESRCATLGAQHGLTQRETEIFAMLARGRNGQFVMDHYVISRNTVKSHTKHIYQKLNVHSRQELIDMVEDAGRE